MKDLASDALVLALDVDAAAAVPVLRDPWLPPDAPLPMPAQVLERGRPLLAALWLALAARPGRTGAV